MLFTEKIKQLREEKQMPQRKFLCKVSANRTCSSLFCNEVVSSLENACKQSFLSLITTLPNRNQKSYKQFAAALEIAKAGIDDFL